MSIGWQTARNDRAFHPPRQLSDADAGGLIDPPFTDAREVHEHLLRVTCEAYFAGDEAAFVRRFVVPQTITTLNGRTRLETAQDVANLFHLQRMRNLRLGVTDMVRISIAAEYLDADTVRGTHVTYILRDRLLLSEPYPNTGILKRVNGFWMISDSEYGDEDPAWLAAAAELSRPPHYLPPRPAAGPADPDT